MNTIIFIVNGQDIHVTYTNEINTPEGPISVTIEMLRNQALVKSGNTGRPHNEWEVRTERGMLLDPATTIKSLNLVDNYTRLLVSLQVGFNG